MRRETTGGLSRPILGRSGFLSEVAGHPYLSASRREISPTSFPLSKLYAPSSYARKGRTGETLLRDAARERDRQALRGDTKPLACVTATLSHLYQVKARGELRYPQGVVYFPFVAGESLLFYERTP